MKTQEKLSAPVRDLVESAWLARQKAKRAFELYDRMYNVRASEYDRYVEECGNPLAEGESLRGNEVLGALYAAEDARNAAHDKLDEAEKVLAGLVRMVKQEEA